VKQQYWLVKSIFYAGTDYSIAFFFLINYSIALDVKNTSSFTMT